MRKAKDVADFERESCLFETSVTGLEAKRRREGADVISQSKDVCGKPKEVDAI